MTEVPRQQSPDTEAVRHEIREEHGDAADATPATLPEEEQVAQELEKDPAHNPDDDALKNIKGGVTVLAGPLPVG
jgi:hypothetical protein